MHLNASRRSSRIGSCAVSRWVPAWMDGAVAARGLHEAADRPVGAVLDQTGDGEDANMIVRCASIGARLCW